MKIVLFVISPANVANATVIALDGLPYPGNVLDEVCVSSDTKYTMKSSELTFI